MSMLIRGADDTAPADRRRIISHLVVTLSEMTIRMNGYDDRSQTSIAGLTAVIQTMASRIAVADDVTFGAIMREAALLIRTLKQRQVEFSQPTIH